MVAPTDVPRDVDGVIQVQMFGVRVRYPEGVPRCESVVPQPPPPPLLFVVGENSLESLQKAPDPNLPEPSLPCVVEVHQVQGAHPQISQAALELGPEEGYRHALHFSSNLVGLKNPWLNELSMNVCPDVNRKFSVVGDIAVL